MTSGYILILAVLVLGGVIATLGDRIGTRVGKARLSLFNLRPRKTAILVTILTGILISASTLGILFAASDQLRKAIFDFDSIQRRLRRTRNELTSAKAQQQQVAAELSKALAQRKTAEKQLAATNQSLKQAQLERSRAQAASLRKQAELNQSQNQLRLVSAQALTLRNEINQLQAERDRVIGQREAEIKTRDRVIAQRESQLKNLEIQQGYLTREVQRLEQEALGFREKNVAIQRGQVLASAVVRIVSPESAQQAVDRLLIEANRAAIQLTRPGSRDEQIIQITTQEVTQLIAKIDDGQDYVIQIFAAANYLVGETPIQVFSDAIRNQAIFAAGDVIASTSVDPNLLTGEQMFQRVNLLLAAANFRARSLGVLTNSVEVTGGPQDVVNFIQQVKRFQQPLELKLVATNVTYTAGPLRVDLVASQNGQVLLRSQNPAPLPPPEQP
mgnify:CR=1 FL=1